MCSKTRSTDSFYRPHDPSLLNYFPNSSRTGFSPIVCSCLPSSEAKPSQGSRRNLGQCESYFSLKSYQMMKSITQNSLPSLHSPFIFLFTGTGLNHHLPTWHDHRLCLLRAPPTIPQPPANKRTVSLHLLRCRGHPVAESQRRNMRSFIISMHTGISKSPPVEDGAKRGACLIFSAQIHTSQCSQKINVRRNAQLFVYFCLEHDKCIVV